MAKITKSDHAPDEQTTFSLVGETFVLDGANSSYESDDPAVVAAAEQSAWLDVEYDDVVVAPDDAVDLDVAKEAQRQHAVEEFERITADSGESNEIYEHAAEERAKLPDVEPANDPAPAVAAPAAPAPRETTFEPTGEPKF